MQVHGRLTRVLSGFGHMYEDHIDVRCRPNRPGSPPFDSRSRRHPPTRHRRAYHRCMTAGTGKLFISHASGDEEYVSEFIDKILRLGCQLPADKVFYTSRRATGISSGANLFEQMRQEAASAPLVIAIVSPTYLTRPTCLAEMGAAWAMKTLLPVLTPGVRRDSLTGPLASMLVGSLDDDSAGEFLDEVFDRVTDAFGLKASAANWTPQKTKWLVNAATNNTLLGIPTNYSAEDVATITRKLTKKTQAYAELMDTYHQLQQQYDELKAAGTDPHKIAAAVLPKDEVGQFQKLSNDVWKCFRTTKLPSCVIKAIRYQVSGDTLTLPDSFHDPNDENPDFYEAQQRGFLTIDDEPAEVTLSDADPRVRRALDAVDSFVHWFSSPERSSDFTEWFHTQYDLPVDAKSSDVWDTILIG